MRREALTGAPVKGSRHAQKAAETVKSLVDWLKKNSSAVGSDRMNAEQMLLDNLDALREL